MIRIILGLVLLTYSALAIDFFSGIGAARISANQIVVNNTTSTTAKSESAGGALSLTLGAFITNLDGVSYTKSLINSAEDNLEIDSSALSYKRVFPIRSFALSAGASYNTFTHKQTLTGSGWSSDKLEFTTSYYTVDFGFITDLPIANTALEIGYKMEVISDNKEASVSSSGNDLVVKYEEFSEWYISLIYLFGSSSPSLASSPSSQSTVDDTIRPDFSPQ